MKKITLLLGLFFSCYCAAQVTKLSSLSSSKFLDSKIIYEDNGEDIYGYLLLFEKNKANKDSHELEFVLLDKNLNKVGSNTFIQSQYSTMWVDLKTTVYFAKKHKDNIYVAVVDVIPQYQNLNDKLGVEGYRVINLKDFKISDQYYLHDFKLLKHEKLKLEQKDFLDAKYMKPTKNNGYIVFDESAQDAAMDVFSGNSSRFKDVKQFRFFDMDFNPKWVFDYNKNSVKSNYYKYEYYTGNDNDMIFKKSHYDKSNTEISYEIINAENGTSKFEISLKSNLHTLDLDEFVFTKDKLIVFASVFEFNKKNTFNVDKKLGFLKIEYDRQTGKELSKDYFYWNALSQNLEINEFGKISGYGFIHFLEFKPTNDDKIVIIGEGFKPDTSTKILDLFTIVLDKNMKLLSYNKIAKNINRIHNYNGNGYSLQNYGLFDYMYSQKLPNGGFVFYYSDNEKKGFDAKKNPNWILGVVTYIDGVFDNQKVQLTTKNGQIYPIKAKNGYVLLREVSNDDKQKDSEIRLEKINY